MSSITTSCSFCIILLVASGTQCISHVASGTLSLQSQSKLVQRAQEYLWAINSRNLLFLPAATEQTSPQSRHPPDQTPPRVDPPRSRHPQSRHPRSRHPPEQTPGADTPLSRHLPLEQTPPGSRLWHTVNERPVRILLECILVVIIFAQLGISLWMSSIRGKRESNLMFTLTSD